MLKENGRIISEASRFKPEGPFRAIIDPTKTLAELVDPRAYGFIHDKIKDGTFPLEWQTEGEVDFYTLRFRGGNFDYSDIVETVRHMGLHLAGSGELLTFGLLPQQIALRRDKPLLPNVVELNTILQAVGRDFLPHQYVMLLGSSGREYDLNLTVAEYPHSFDPRNTFLVFKKP